MRSDTNELSPSTERPGKRTRPMLFLATFAPAWLALDRLATSPPNPFAALGALGASAGIVIAGEALIARARLRTAIGRLGFGAPAARAVLVSLIVGAMVITTFVVGAAAAGVHLELRSHWPAVLVASFLFHGLAEELVWRGFVFGRLRRTHTFRAAILLSMPLIALTHVPIIIANGWLVGALAVTTAAVTCAPLSYLYERGGRTVWVPAVVHGSIGTWQIFERTYPIQFKMIILLASIFVPQLALGFSDRFFDPTRKRHTQGET
jgi:membrane protease YdiL (CAAX protease family)